MKVKFWGVRGSIPSPLTGQQVEEKVLSAIEHTINLIDKGEIKGSDHHLERSNSAFYSLPFATRSTYGGNTTCVEINVDGYPIICDMGTGIREQGKAMMSQIFANKGIQGTILQSHVHWDHIQGMPFWGPLFLPREKFENAFFFYGGKSWDAQLELVLQGQMNPPVFPVHLAELRETAMLMEFNTIYDTWTARLNTWAHEEAPEVEVRARKLFHPQETFGYAIKANGHKIVFTTDHEPYADGIPNGLRDLVNGSDIWITDCQYSHEMYLGKKDNVQKMGWGHSYPDYIAKVAKECGAKRVITTHHDPSSTDIQIEEIAKSVQELGQVPTVPAYEGLEIAL